MARAILRFLMVTAVSLAALAGPASARGEFKPARGSSDNLVQPVVLTGPDGKVCPALYLMQKLEGVWKIAGVSLTRTGQDSI